jgi:hypothetical protein
MTTNITPLSVSVPSTVADSAVQSPTGFYTYVKAPPVQYTVSDGEITAQNVDLPQLAELK